MCLERDGNGDRCTVEGEHQEIVNSKGQRALAHSTPMSMWSVPVSALWSPRKQTLGPQLSDR